MSPEPPPGAADDTNVDGRGEQSGIETTRDSFVWTTEPDSGADGESGAADDDASDLRDERADERRGPDSNGQDGRRNGSGGGRHDDHAGRPGTTAGGSALLDPERYLLAGEAPVERVDTEAGWVVVTSHRLLVYDPTADGKRFESVDRPNVVGVEATEGGNPMLLSYIARAAMYGVVLLGGGLVGRSLGLRGLFSTTVASESTPAVSGLVSMLSFVGALVGLIVDVFVWGGVLLGLVALGLAVWYLRGRHPTLVLERAGGDDITVRLRSTTDVDSVVDALERALAAELGVASA